MPSGSQILWHSGRVIPLYRPGHSLLHRTPAWLKLALLLALGILIAAWRDHWQIAASAWAAVLAGYLLARGPLRGLRDLGAMLWRLKWLAVLIVIPQLIFRDYDDAAITTLRILAVVLLAGLFTLTTRVSDVMELILRLFTPLERAGLGRIGLTAERVGLAMALAMRSVPVVFGFYSEIRRARQARGVRSGVTGTVKMTTPLLVMTLRHADQTAEALAARGVR